MAALGSLSTSYAGTFYYTPGTWGSFTGTGAGDSTAYTANACSYGISPDLTLISGTSSQNYTLGGTFGFSITWAPSSGTDPVPSYVTVTFNRQSVLSAFGTGVAMISQGSTQLLEMDASNNFLAGFTTPLSQFSFSLPVTLQSNGTYLATGSITTDTLSSTWNSGAGGNTSSEESFTLDSMVGVF